jgi:biotin carboxyl carrier protein
VKVEVVIDGRAARLEFDPGRFRYQREDGGVIEGEHSVVQLNSGAYSVLIGGRNYAVVAGAPGEVIVNGRVFTAAVFDPRGMRGRQSKDAGEGRRNIVAMMPGKVVRILVADGAAVEAGQGLIVVEAMKMQNEMKSPKAGRVVEVKVSEDATVAAGDVLMVIE